MTFNRTTPLILLTSAILFAGCTTTPTRPAADADQESLVAYARSLCDEAPLIDGHNDLAWGFRSRANGHIEQLVLTDDLTAIEKPTHTDIPRLHKGGMGAQFWSVWIPINEYGGKTGDTRIVLEQIDTVHRMAAMYPDHFEMAYTADDIERIHKQGKIACLIGMEGGHSIENSIPVLRMTYAAGARYMTLTHGKSLRWAGSATDEHVADGLSPFGKEVVREMNRMGMLVDLSHVSPAAMHDALDVTRSPVIFSHSSAFSVCRHPRNVPDDVLKRVKENDGVVMVTFLAFYISEDLRTYPEREQAERERLDALYASAVPDESARQAKVSEGMAAWADANPRQWATVEQVADHIDYIRDLIGVDHIGMGGDYDGMPPGPVGLEDVSDYPNLLAELIRRGYTDEELKKIMGGNLLRVMREVERRAIDLQAMYPPSSATIEELDGPLAISEMQ
ncbi:MAG: membrane dipeptidase [Planctomycetes bacterium]|nr:membrane dipeptidase [Planctomycetota bacterium]NOG55738.1 membrane dipeptidase [Planctomycetota bacterium]